MNDYEGDDAIAAALQDTVVTVQELLEKRRIFPALILMYSALDILGSLLRPKANPDTSGEDFKNWVERYLLPDSSLDATSGDLWAARCGLLHTSTPGSRNSRTGKAREVHYVKGDKKLAGFLQQEFEKVGANKVIVDVDVLFDAFLGGLMKFIGDIKADAAVRDIVLYHAKTIFEHCSYKVCFPGSL